MTLVALDVVACDRGNPAVGRWEIVAVDGLGPRAAVPLRVHFPAGRYDTLELAADRMWKEFVVDSLVLELTADGRFTERKVEARAQLVSRPTYERPEYVSGAFGGDLIRDDAPAAVHQVGGTWTLAGDSLTLRLDREAFVDDMAANLADALPGDAPVAEIHVNVDRVVPAEPPPRWSGVLAGDRLELREAEGREVVFAKAGASR